jgi:beta-N-acetylhexosaminidase
LRRFFPLLAAVSALTVLASLLQPIPIAQAEPRLQISKAQAVLASMTPEEKVGQLFLVTFQGTDTHDQTHIYDLIVNHHVGGVVLLAGNDNFLPEPDTISSAHKLINALQTVDANATPIPASEVESQTGAKVYVPLFVGISQEGDGTPNDQILSGLTPLPNAMAIGATWDPEIAQQVGAVMGSELSALGFNLYLGPSLDVVDSPNPATHIDLGPRVFGGDPFWVGEMGRAYISGLHMGSNAHMTVVAKHFPGRGDSDRSPEEEVPTVRKSLEQLKQIELPPFSMVTNSADPTGLVDGLLVSHIRYQGFQGNIRATSRPVSLDESALSSIVSLPEFTTWRSNGGLMVSDALGSKALRDFYSQTGENFTPRLVARDALTAGNDLLYLGNINSENEDTYTATLGILDFFAQQYHTDRVFAKRVDDAVLRILAQKFRMYEAFELPNVLTPAIGLATIGTSQETVLDVARNAATLITPNLHDLNTLLPSAPLQTDRIAFLTDTVTFKQCTTCLSQDSLAFDALQKTILRLYGPQGSGQVFTSRLNSFPFTEVETMLNGESQTDIEAILDRANWIVISLTDNSKGQVALLQRFFSERPNLIRNKNVILFSFTAPYYFDATDISKLTAYYALYSKQPAFVEVAARLLFQQNDLPGYSPVSIPSLQYDLSEVTKPDPTQIIPLYLDQTNGAEATPTVNPTLTAVIPTQTEVPLYRIGDTINLKAGPILDHNQHLVPDGTPVRFIMSLMDENGEILQSVDSTTIDGVARASFVIGRPGKVEIRVVSEPAVISGFVRFDASNEGAAVTIVAPTPQVTPTLQVTPTVMPTSTPTSELITPEGYPRVGIWLLVMLAVFGSAILMFWAVSRIVSRRWGLRWAFCVFLGGLAAYNYLALGFPGAADWVASSSGAFGVLLLTLAGELVGAFGAWLWMKIPNESKSSVD